MVERAGGHKQHDQNLRHCILAHVTRTAESQGLQHQNPDHCEHQTDHTIIKAIRDQASSAVTVTSGSCKPTRAAKRCEDYLTREPLPGTRFRKEYGRHRYTNSRSTFGISSPCSMAQRAKARRRASQSSTNRKAYLPQTSTCTS